MKNSYQEEFMSPGYQLARLNRSDFLKLVQTFSSDPHAIVNEREYKSTFRFVVYKQEILVVDIGASGLDRKVVLFKGVATV
mmetsp:Transcript_42081/g.64514  ORF Transcript_42081/g.64514 Transcript_42081/m.64514 type:complete len:81 (-) Transcript_42081:1-243(-)